MKRYHDSSKRATDILVSAIILVGLAPLMVALAVLVRMKLGSPVLFRQERPGMDAKVFQLIKFRTMREPDLTNGLIADQDRLTRLGATLRSLSLDELPTLWNVFRGDMSLVGPRPLRTYYLPLYTAEQARRHEVRPGITGLAQVNGRNLLSWEERFALDVLYVETRGPLTDLKILLRTLSSVLRRTGISAPGSVTMTPFTGSTRDATGEEAS